MDKVKHNKRKISSGLYLCQSPRESFATQLLYFPLRCSPQPNLTKTHSPWQNSTVVGARIWFLYLYWSNSIGYCCFYSSKKFENFFFPPLLLHPQLDEQIQFSVQVLFSVFNLLSPALTLKSLETHTHSYTHVHTHPKCKLALFLQNCSCDVLINSIDWSKSHDTFFCFWQKKKTQGKFVDEFQGTYTHKHTQAHCKEWLIPSLVSYCMSVVMCWNYWSGKRTWQPQLLWNKKEINAYFTHRTTHTKALMQILTFFTVTIQSLFTPAVPHTRMHTCSTLWMYYYSRQRGSQWKHLRLKIHTQVLWKLFERI